jgi:hypothetical protein
MIECVTIDRSEWNKWTAKAHHGQRCYASVPTITEPAEFGHTIALWWNDMQPEFRKGEGMLPKEIYVDGGGSGDVWAVGTSAERWSKRFCIGSNTYCVVGEESTESLWGAVVLDVTKSLEIIASKAGKKRGCDHDHQENSKFFFEAF